MLRRIAVALLLLPLAVFANNTDHLDQKKLFQKAAPAVVLIYQYKFNTKGEVIGVHFGTGSIIRSDGVILTNAHVVGKAKWVYVLLKNKEKILAKNIFIYIAKNRKNALIAKVIARFPEKDIALLKLPGQYNHFPTIPLGDSDKVSAGDEVVVIGHPRGLVWSLTKGIVSSNRGDIQTDAAINPGNSGGPLLNSQGEIIGVNSYVLENAENIGFARPINMVKKLLKQSLITLSPQPHKNTSPSSPKSTLKRALRAILLHQYALVSGKKIKKNVGKFFAENALQKDVELVLRFRHIAQHAPQIVKVQVQGPKATITLVYSRPNQKNSTPSYQKVDIVMKLNKGTWKIIQLGQPQPHSKTIPYAQKTPTPSNTPPRQKPISTPPSTKPTPPINPSTLKTKQQLKSLLAKLWQAVETEDYPTYLSLFHLPAFTPTSDIILAVYGPNGKLARIETDSGRLLPLNSEGWSAAGSWALARNKLYITSKASGKLYQILPYSGREKVISQQGWKYISHLTSIGENLFAINPRLKLIFAFHPAKYQLRKIAIGYQEVGAFVPLNDKIYITSRITGRLYELNPLTGKEKILQQKGWQEIRTGCAFQGKLYLLSRNSGNIYEINPITGQERVVSSGWQNAISMRASQKEIYLAAPNGNIYQLHPLTGIHKLICKNLPHLRKIIVFSPQQWTQILLLEELFSYLQTIVQNGEIRHTSLKISTSKSIILCSAKISLPQKPAKSSLVNLTLTIQNQKITQVQFQFSSNGKKQVVNFGR
ncbi:MAG: hypothetical protein D6805_08855 [Planctomycetota bacterium]|nr:MAG: hypothetical protein D6805_08855 [Planctomycetota bacterium]